MNNLQKNDKFFSLLISLFSFFILVFFTINIYSDMQWNWEANDIKKEELLELDKKLTKLNNLKTNLGDKNNSDSKKIKKFSMEFSEDKLIWYINDYVELVNKENKDTGLLLDSISFSETRKSELWFNEISIDLQMTILDKFILINMIEYFSSDINEYWFIITNLNFPIEKSGPYKLNIPLKMYVK